MKTKSGGGFPSLHIELETKEEVHFFMVICQSYMLPHNRENHLARAEAAALLEQWARNHYNQFANK